MFSHKFSVAVSSLHFRAYLWPLSVGVAVSVVGLSYALTQRAQARSGRVYVAQGYGGYAPIQPTIPQSADTDPLRDLKAQYRVGQWTQVEAQAQAVLDRQQFSSNPQERRQAAQAELMAGYASAWRKNYLAAGERFLAVQRLAGELPDHGAQPTTLGETPLPTLEEEAAFQHAVCVGAEGDKTGAEAEYDGFMQRYPQSILVHAAVKRIARLHGGDIPASADGLWKQAMRQQKQAEAQKRREQALCGPECLAELLRRAGKAADAHTLATEMKTSADGTTLEQMAQTAKKHGFVAQGLALTQHGLAQQSLPLIVLLKPGHYVLAQRVTAENVTVWDPDAQGTGRGAEKTYPLPEWKQAWTGMAMAVR